LPLLRQDALKPTQPWWTPLVLGSKYRYGATKPNMAIRRVTKVTGHDRKVAPNPLKHSNDGEYPEQ
jgi:hypothetical protein